MPGIEPGAFHMQSERSTTELHPLERSSFVDYGGIVAVLHFTYLQNLLAENVHSSCHIT